MIDRIRLLHDPEPEGLDVSVLTCAEVGLFVIAGENNAGKTRALGSVASARILGRLDRAKLEEHFARVPDATIAGARTQLPEIEVSWPRDVTKPLFRSEPTPQAPPEIQLTPATRGALARLFGSRQADAEGYARNAAFQWVVPRPAKFLATNRYINGRTGIRPEYEPQDGSPEVWVSTIVNLEQNASKRPVFQAIADRFSQITDGLGLVASREYQEAILLIQDSKRERNLNECGDGLRDLVALLLYSKVYHKHDLLIDEPGLRLHPRAQRRLLAYLEEEAKTRAIWVASHDGVFIGAPQAVRRFFVSRIGGTDASTTTELVGRAECANALTDLGWEARDAFLADRVLLVEGPSDKTAFTEVVRWLEGQNPSWGGTVVSHLGGNGAVWGMDRGVLKERVSLVRRIVPTGACSVLLDRDARTIHEIEALTKSLAALEVPIHFLDVGELEDHWLDVGTVQAIFSGLAQDARDAGQDVSDPTLDEVARAVKETDDIKKASARLEAMAGRLEIRFSKDRSAVHAIAALSSRPTTATSDLMEAVRQAFV